MRKQHLVTALLEEKKFSEARTLLEQIPMQKRLDSTWLPSILALADGDGTLSQLVDEWKKQGNPAPAENDLRDAAVHLSETGRRRVMRFVYERAIAMRDLSAPNLLGLAAIRLDDGDTPRAVDLLKRLTSISANIEQDSDAAAQLLEDRHKPAEAISFLRALVQDSPWNAAYKARLGIALLAVNGMDSEAPALLSAVATDPEALYSERLTAAKARQSPAAIQARRVWWHLHPRLAW